MPDLDKPTSSEGGGSTITAGQVSLVILNQMLEHCLQSVTLQAFQDEQLIRDTYGADFVASTPTLVNGVPKANSKAAAQRYEINNRVKHVHISGRDVYGNEKATDTRYFQCSNCGRNIAGVRFAAHIVRCLSGRSSRTKPDNRPGSRSDTP